MVSIKQLLIAYFGENFIQFYWFRFFMEDLDGFKLLKPIMEFYIIRVGGIVWWIPLLYLYIISIDWNY